MAGGVGLPEHRSQLARTPSCELANSSGEGASLRAGVGRFRVLEPPFAREAGWRRQSDWSNVHTLY
jgi:hypothetical protein